MRTSRDCARCVAFALIVFVAGQLPAFAGQQVAASGCDMKALGLAQADFERLQRLRELAPATVSIDALRAASSDYVLQSEACYQALYDSSTLQIDDGGMRMGAGGAVAQPFVTGGTKWGAGSPFVGGPDIAGPGLPGGTVSYSFVANGVSLVNEGVDANLAVTSLPGFESCFVTRITAAFAAWSSIANVQFVEVADTGVAFNASGAVGDIRIGAHTFDGPFSVLAHAYLPPPNGNSASGDVHFDRQEAWSCAPMAGAIDIGIVALHEIGHAIGLSHEPARLAVMNPVYNSSMTMLQADDIAGAVSIYGPAQAPALARILGASPASGEHGQQLQVTLAGEHTHFGATTTVAFSGGQVTVERVIVNSATSLDAVIAIGSVPVFQLEDITATTGSEVAVLIGGFQIRGRVTPGDTDADGKGDLVWRHRQTGDVAVWLMDGGVVKQGPIVASGVPLAWQIENVRDVDGDGRADLIWRNIQTGDESLWLMSGSAIAQTPLVAAGVPLAWQIARAGDVDGNGRADLIWRNSETGDVAVWLMNGGAITQAALVFAGVSPVWQIAEAGDVDGDGRTDLVWRQRESGDVAVWLMDGATVKQTPLMASGVPLAWQIAGIGDLDGDGQAELLWRETQSGDVAAWFMNGATLQQAPLVAAGVPLGWQIAVVRDVDGDGKADLVWRHATTGDVTIWLMDGITIRQTPLVAAGVDLAWQIQR